MSHHPLHLRRLSTASVTALLIVLGVSRQTLSEQEPADPIQKKSSSPAQPTAKDHEAAVRLEEMTSIVHAFKLTKIDGANRTDAELVPDPLHRWTDPTRPFSGGALWVWKSRGRPVAIMGIELYAAWSLEFVSLSTGLVEARDGGLLWRPQKAGVEFREIPGAPAPAEDQPKRLRQIRDLSKRITAGEFYDNKHYALRLLPHPIDRYADPAAGVVDGAIFICANGTNPEILLLIEARRKGTGPPVWSFAAAPLSRAEVSLKLDGKDLWISPTIRQTAPEDTYYDVLRGRGSRAIRRVIPQKDQQ